MRAVDECVGKVVDAILSVGGDVLITADHGNAEIMIDPQTGGPFTAHSTNPVPCILVSKAHRLDTDVYKRQIQSSSATMGIIQAFAMQGVMGLDSAVYVILGLNIGTCVTAIIASLSGTKTAKRTAIALLFFNVFGSLIFMLAMHFLPIVDWVKSWTPDEPVRQLANFHTFFNVINAFIFIGCPQLLAKAACFFVRGEDKKLEGRKLKYIDKNADSQPVACLLYTSRCV